MNQDIIVNSNGGNIYTPNIISFEERQIELEKIEEKEEKQRQLNERLRKNSPFSNFYQFNRDFSMKDIYLSSIIINYSFIATCLTLSHSI